MSLIEANRWAYEPHTHRKDCKLFITIALTMGYLVAINAWVENQVRSHIGASYANPTLGLLSSIGGLGSWACILPAAYFYATSDYDKNLWDGLIFVLCTFGGAILAGLIKFRTLSYLISPFVLFANSTLAYVTYSMSR